MGLKIFGVGGIDQKSNNLLRDPRSLLNSRNVMANIENEYVKRPGTEEDTDFTDDDYDDMIFIKSLNQYFHRFGTDYVAYENGVRKDIYKFADPLLSGDSNISLAEYLDTAIFTHEENQNFTAKYDGHSIYRAGLPVPLITSPTAGTLFALFFYQFIDSQGNTIFGPSFIQPLANSVGSFTVPTFKDSGFYGGYLRIPIVAGPGVSINSGSRTIPYDSLSPDIVIGSVVTFRSANGSPTEAGVSVNNFSSQFFVQFIVESINTGTNEITFTADSVGDNTVFIQSLSDGVYNVQGSLVIRYYFSTEETTGYYGLIEDSYYTTLDNSLATQTITYDTAIDESVLLSNIYDITTSKLRPPKCKYVYTYGFQLVCAPAISFYDFENQETKYTNNDLVMYSDTSNGDLGENFSEINRQLIGNTYDGEITGMTRVKDSMIVFKTRSPYALDGVLIPGQYTMRKIETNEIGCTSAKSILLVEDGVVFQGQDGLYAIDGYKCEKVTKTLDKFFRTIDNTLTRSVMNVDLDQYLFWTDQGFVVFDYEYKGWYIWDSIDASKGLTVDNEGSIRFFSPTISTKFQAALNDSGVAIDAYIRSSWLDFEEPGLLKKSTFLRIYSMNNQGQQVSLKYYLDWSDLKTKGPFTIDMSDVSTKTIKRNLDIIQNQSFSFEFRNNVIDEDLNISGYEVEADVIQQRDKNVK